VKVSVEVKEVVEVQGEELEVACTAVPSIWMASRQGPSGFDRRHHRPEPGAKGGDAASVDPNPEGTPMPRFAHHRLQATGGQAYHAALDLAAAVLAQAGRTVALLTGLVRKFA
jgi:hypothetical protein